MKDSEFIIGELWDFGVEFAPIGHQDMNDNHYIFIVNLEAVQFKNLGTVVTLFNELEDCVR